MRGSFELYVTASPTDLLLLVLLWNDKNSENNQKLLEKRFNKKNTSAVICSLLVVSFSSFRFSEFVFTQFPARVEVTEVGSGAPFTCSPKLNPETPHVIFFFFFFARPSNWWFLSVWKGIYGIWEGSSREHS